MLSKEKCLLSFNKKTCNSWGLGFYKTYIPSDCSTGTVNPQVHGAGVLRVEIKNYSFTELLSKCVYDIFFKICGHAKISTVLRYWESL